ncbi:MAG: hypothetical protein RLY76_195, partial [Actinomycetota bacterium]
ESFTGINKKVKEIKGSDREGKTEREEDLRQVQSHSS